MSAKIIKPSTKVLLKNYILVSIFIVVLIYAIFSSRGAWIFEEDFVPYLILDIAMILLGAVISIIGCWLLLKNNYYEVINSSVIHHKLKAQTIYDFDHVLYIDKDYTLKHKTLLFYNERGKSLFLVLDKDLELLEIFENRCKKLLTKEEFQKKFPKVKL